MRRRRRRSSSAKRRPINDGLKPEAGPLRIYNYDDYVNPDVVSAFEGKYGVKVEITTFTTDDEAITKFGVRCRRRRPPSLRRARRRCTS